MLSRFKTIVALMRNPKVSSLPKFLVAGAILYVLLPFDFVPDVAPVVGWLDDAMFLVGALSLLFGSAPKTPTPAPAATPAGPIIDVTPEPPKSPTGERR
jgi:uncharacterized membrane protein YkvA (DUF1232 family)